MYLVTGATGNIGNGVAKLLSEQGHEVRVLVRESSRTDQLPRGVDVVVGDLDDPGSVGAGLDGVDAVFALFATPGVTQGEVMIEAAKSVGVSRVVLLSSIGARLRPLPTIGAVLAAREDLFRGSGLAVTYLRPNTLMSNALEWAEGIRGDGRVVVATGEGRMPCVDPADIARVATVALTEDGHIGHGYILNGLEALTSREQVEILADVLGRDIDVVDVLPKQLATESIENGVPSEAAEALRDLNEMFRVGRAGVIADDIENVTCVAPRTFRQWCGQHASDFI
jgi:uncharacterized protein YbjT (DUF2867 family)